MRTRTLSAAASTTCLAALLACAGPAPADQILVVHDASLTTYVPSSKSNIQDARPLPEQRGVGLDGAPRGIGGGAGGDPYPKCGKAAPVGPTNLPPGHDGGLVTPGDLFGPGGGGPDIGDAGGGSGLSAPPGMDYPTGAPTISDVDLAFPAEVPWIIGRNYNCRQKDSGGSYFASDGYQGKNWFQTSQPELVFHDSATNSEDMIYLIYGADRSIEFKRALDGQQQPSTNTFRAVNGAVGAILLTTGTGPDLATWYRPDGWRMVFFWVGDGDIDDDIEGSIWRVIDPAGNTAYVGHATDAATALSSYDATTGAIATAYDTYYCHNWRHDVSVLISAAGAMVEWAKYSAYGIPFGLPVGDTNSDGLVDSTDVTNVTVWAGVVYKVTGDTNLDGTIDNTDLTKVTSQSGTTLGWWALSDEGNRKGYAGYEFDPELAYAAWHVRHRVLNSDLGTWTRRDPLAVGIIDTTVDLALVKELATHFLCPNCQEEWPHTFSLPHLTAVCV